MKFIFLVFFCIAVPSYVIPISADSLPLKTVEDLLRQYPLIITGKILSISNIPDKNLTTYDFKIIRYVTSPQSLQIINATANSTTTSAIHDFHVGDYVQVYLTPVPNGYVISPYSFKLNESCNFVGPDYTSLIYSHISGVAISTKFFDSKGDIVEPMPNKDLFFQTSLNNNTPMNKTDAEVILTREGNSTPVFDEKKEFDVKPCSVPDVLWKFVLPQSGIYVIKYMQFSRIYENKIFFDNSTFTYSFITPKNYTEISDIPHLSPLKQIESGVSIKDVTCKQGFQLIFKAEEGSPVCVKPDTVNILIERGWAKASQ